MTTKAKWEEYTVTWENATANWEAVFLAVVKQVGDDTQTAIVEDLEPKKKKKFISLVCRRNSIKIYEDTKENITAKMTVEAIKFALDEVKKPELEIIDAI
tara:strand:- start:201 stop:500 length:300 start_codon:yes stop_codon:yes gene_type:complete